MQTALVSKAADRPSCAIWTISAVAPFRTGLQLISKSFFMGMIPFRISPIIAPAAGKCNPGFYPSLGQTRRPLMKVACTLEPIASGLPRLMTRSASLPTVRLPSR